jgi:CRP/FNR family transcriptional regulator
MRKKSMANAQAAQKVVEEFFSSYTPLKFKKGDTIIRAGDEPNGVMYLVGGHVRMYALSPSGDVVVLHVFAPGSFFPMLWAIAEAENRYYFDAATATEVYRAPKADVLAFFSRHPEVLFDLTRRLLSGMAGLLMRLESLVFGEASVKTALLLLHFAKHFGEREEGGIVLRVPLAHREIASWIGTTRETASLQMEQLKKEGIIKYKGRTIIITDMESLKKKSSYT